MQANTIDEVILQLEKIIEQSIADQDPMGFFAALYHQVTVTVKDGIRQSYYQDGPQMEKLDILFANRYLYAYAQFKNKETCTQSWLYAFDCTRRFWPTVLQNLLLGINAHINLDLGIAAAHTCPGEGIHALKADFDKINIVLAAMVTDVEKSLTTIWPRLSWVLEKFGKTDTFLIDFSMKQARDGAWKFATELARLPPEQQLAQIQVRDIKIRKIAHMISKPGFFISSIFMIIRIGEIGTVAKKIETLWKKRSLDI